MMAACQKLFEREEGKGRKRCREREKKKGIIRNVVVPYVTHTERDLMSLRSIAIRAESRQGARRRDGGEFDTEYTTAIVAQKKKVGNVIKTCACTRCLSLSLHLSSTPQSRFGGSRGHKFGFMKLLRNSCGGGKTFSSIFYRHRFVRFRALRSHRQLRCTTVYECPRAEKLRSTKMIKCAHKIKTRCLTDGQIEFE